MNMNGQILEFSGQNEAGLIAGNDGNRYQFCLSDWVGPNPPRALVKVEFQVSGDKAVNVNRRISKLPKEERKAYWWFQQLADQNYKNQRLVFSAQAA
jgi:hypothetical protein